MPIIIAKNISKRSIMVQDLGIDIPRGSKVKLSDICDLLDIFTSKDLEKYVLTRRITINNGERDLNPLEGVNHIRVRTAFEDLSSLNYNVCRTPPKSAKSGDQWFHPDTGLLYILDDKRAKWLSVSRNFITFNYRGYADKTYLQVGCINGSRHAAYMLPRPITITAISASTEKSFIGHKNKCISIVDGRNNVFEFNLLNRKYSNTLLNVDAENELKCYVWRYGFGIKNPIVNVEFSWRLHEYE